MTIRLDGPERLRRVAMISLHTSPLDQPGTGDAGGMNVYVIELAKRLAERDIEVDIFTRSTSSQLPPVVQAADGVRVQHIVAGPFEGLTKGELPGQLCAFARDVLRTEASHDPGHYDVVHSHYWLSGQVGALARDRWGIPLAHSMHTMAKVKNEALAEGDTPEPVARVIGEEQVVAAADMLIANTDDEARQLVTSYDADATRVEVVHPGVDLDVFRPTSQAEARTRLGIAPDAHLLVFVGRIQPLKAPDILVRAAADLVARDPSLRSTLQVAVVGDPPAPGWRSPRRWPSWPHRSACPTWSGSCRRSRGPSWSTGTPPRPRSASRRTTSRSGWSRSRPRASAPRSSPPPSAASRPPSATGTPACSSAGTTRPTTPGPSSGSCARPVCATSCRGERWSRRPASAGT